MIHARRSLPDRGWAPRRCMHYDAGMIAPAVLLVLALTASPAGAQLVDSVTMPESAIDHSTAVTKPESA